ncbi:MAG: autotransporter domain-containing protein, partial [Candidatus Latescibacterota bacterium]
WGNAGANLNVVEKVDRQNGVAGDLLLGWAVRNNVVVGAEFDVWSQFFQDTRWVFNLSSVAVSYYPVGGLFFTGGLGVGTSRVEFTGSEGNNIQQDQAGLGASLAGGYEFRILEQIALAPKVKWAYLDIGGDVTQSVDYLTITLQLIWYKPQS